MASLSRQIPRCLIGSQTALRLLLFIKLLECDVPHLLCPLICGDFTGATLPPSFPCGTTCVAPAPQPCLTPGQPGSLLVLAAHLCYVAALLFGLQLLLKYPWHAVSAFLLAYIAIPPVLASAAFSANGVPEGVRCAFGSLMDIYRRHNAVAYAAQGGRFQGQAAAHATSAPGAAAVCGTCSSSNLHLCLPPYR